MIAAAVLVGIILIGLIYLVIHISHNKSEHFDIGTLLFIIIMMIILCYFIGIIKNHFDYIVLSQLDW
jgi:hypothetical protein